MRAIYLFIVLFLSGCVGTPSGRKPMTLNRFFDDPGVSRLAAAAAEGDVAQVERLVQQGVDPNAIGNEGMSPLWWVFATSHNRAGMAALMRLGADPDYIPAGGRYSMLSATMAGSKEQLTVRLAETLLAGGANPNRRDERGNTPLNFALFGHASLEKVQMLVRYGADIHTVDNCGKSLLWSALAVRAHDVAKWLIEQGVDVHRMNKNGGTSAWIIHDALINNLYSDWARTSALELKVMLEARGVKFPPPSPQDNQAKMVPKWEPCRL